MKPLTPINVPTAHNPTTNGLTTDSPATDNSKTDNSNKDAATEHERVRVLEKAVELEVDKSDFSFASAVEEQMWDELESEFLERKAKLGPVWIAA